MTHAIHLAPGLMTRQAPLHVVWWLVSRASGVVGLVLMSLAVLMGLAMAARVLHRPGLKRAVARAHEHVAVAALGAVALHGVALLGDRWLRPGLRGIAVPFAMSYRPGFTGAGIVAGYLAVLVGPSFYIRRRIGAGRWRRLHRLSVGIWLLALAHTLGAGSDASRLWLRALVAAPVPFAAYLLVVRSLAAKPVKKPTPGAGSGVRASRAPGRAARIPRDYEMVCGWRGPCLFRS